MATPLYSTDIIPMTSRPTLTVMDDGDYFVILDTSTGKISKILKTNVMTALKITYDNKTSGLTAETVQAALDELAVNLGSTNTVIESLKGVGWTDENLVDHEERLDTLEGTGEGSVAKAIDDAVSPLSEVVDTNRLYSDSQYLELKAKSDALQVKCNTLQAEVYTDDPILQYGATEIIGKGYEADDTPIDVSANVVDGSLSMEQKGLTITNIIPNLTTLAQTRMTITESGGIFTLTLTSNVAFGVIPLNLLLSDKLFSRIRWRVLSGSYTKNLGFGLYKTLDAEGWASRQTIKTLDNLEYDLWYEDEVLTTVSSADYAYIGFHGYPTPGTRSTFEIEFVTTNHLNALGLDHITDTAILAKLLPYVDGTKNVGKMGLRVVDDNLLNIYNNWYNAYLNSGRTFLTPPLVQTNITSKTENVITLKSVGAFSGVAQIIDVSNFPAGYYRLNYESFIASSGDTVFGWSTYADYADFTSGGAVAVAKSLAYGGQTKAIPITSDTKYLLVSAALWNASVTGTLIKPMLNLGSSALPYEPYQEQLTFLPAIGNSLPNGVADSVKTVADGWEHSKRVSTPASVGSGVAMNKTNYPTAKNGGQWVNELTAGGTEIGVVGTDSTTGAGMLRFELATPIVTKYDLPHLTSGKTIHRFAGEEKIALYGTGVTYSENVLSVLSAVKFVAGVMTDITSLATITANTVTFSGVSSTDVVYVKVEHDVDKPLGILEHTPAVSNTASRLAAIEAWIAAQGA